VVWYDSNVCVLRCVVYACCRAGGPVVELRVDSGVELPHQVPLAAQHVYAHGRHPRHPAQALLRSHQVS
jgi:hypothetical protein